MMPLVDTPWALSYRLPMGHAPLNCFLSVIFSNKFADRQTHTDTSADNKGRLTLWRHNYEYRGFHSRLNADARKQSTVSQRHAVNYGRRYKLVGPDWIRAIARINFVFFLSEFSVLTDTEYLKILENVFDHKLT